MTTPAWDDLDEFLDAGDFAVVGTITLSAGGTRDVPGIYDGPYKAARMADTEHDTTVPRFTCKQADTVGIKRGDGITIPGEGAFGILSEPQPDGTGMAVLELAPE
jgi:hypothetical protein